MKIELVIGLDTLGDANTREDNERYAAAVEAAIIEKFPDADVIIRGIVAAMPRMMTSLRLLRKSRPGCGTPPIINQPRKKE